MSKFKKLTKSQVAELNLNKEDYFLAVNEGAGSGIDAVQIYLKKDDFKVAIALLTIEHSANNVSYDYYECDEATFDAVSEADDIGRAEFNGLAPADHRGKWFALRAFEKIAA